MTKHYPKKHLLGQKIESWKGLLIFAFLNSSSSHKRENEKLCVLKCSKKLPREQRLDQLLHLSTVCLATVNCSILSAKPTAISTHFSLFQKRLYGETPASGIKCCSAPGHWSLRTSRCVSDRGRAGSQSRRAARCWGQVHAAPSPGTTPRRMRPWPNLTEQGAVKRPGPLAANPCTAPALRLQESTDNGWQLREPGETPPGSALG